MAVRTKGPLGIDQVEELVIEKCRVGGMKQPGIKLRARVFAVLKGRCGVRERPTSRGRAWPTPSNRRSRSMPRPPVATSCSPWGTSLRRMPTRWG